MKKLIRENNRWSLCDESHEYDQYYFGENYLFESSLSRIWKHNENGFIMMSAFRGNDEEKNKKSHQRLKQKLKSLNLGFFEIDGVYKYDDGHTEKELSVFIPFRDTYTTEELKKNALELRKDFNQESVLFKYPKKDGGDAVLLYANKEDKIGKDVNYDKVSDAYSKLRKGSHKDRSFVIEGVRKPINHISAMGFKKENILY